MKPTIEDLILIERNLCLSLHMLRDRMKELSINDGLEELLKLQSDYELMCDCMKQGMRDPEGEKVYTNMLRLAYRIYNNVRLLSLFRCRPELDHAKVAADKFISHGNDVKDTLEKFVQDIALASLLPVDKQMSARHGAFSTHQHFMEGLFNWILVSSQWNENNATYYRSLLLSPTVDQNDISLIVSAISLALLTVFDINKWLVLVDVYEKSLIENVRQRALVGIAIAMPKREASIFCEIEDSVKHLCSIDKFRREIIELQMQLIYCQRTESDNAEIQRDIMPTLVRNSNLRVADHGEFVEKDDDALNSDSLDKRMTEIEDKMKKMADMQRNGSDIYFGGFSHMKSFSFFYQISNWFVPFYMGHPDVTNAVQGRSVEKVIPDILKRAPFCDSDKYSFVFAIASVFDRLPNGVKDSMINSRDLLVGASSDVDYMSPAFIRRSYLQNLYRFFFLYNGRKGFSNPFVSSDSSRTLFMSNGLFVKYLVPECLELARFLLKQRMYGTVADFCESCMVCGMISNEMLLCQAQALLFVERYADAVRIYEKLDGKFQGNTNNIVLRGLADSLFMLRHYDEAAVFYDKLICEGWNVKRCVLYKSLSLINSGKIKEGMSELFRLDYELENDISVKRAIAWGYLMDAKPVEADRIYEKIVVGKSFVESDLLNYAYAKWLQSENSEALKLFKEYKKIAASSKGNVVSLADDFKSDSMMLRRNGVLDFEQKIMLDLTSRD